MTRKVVQIGSSCGVTLPQEMMERTGIHLGDQVELSVLDIGVLIAPVKDRTEQAIQMTKALMEKYDKAFKELSKK